MTLNTKMDRQMALLELLDGAECTTDEVMRRLHLPAEKKRSVQRDLVELQHRNLITATDRKRYTRVRPVSALNPAQALALYTAARMLAHLNLQDNEHYLNILEKLTAVLPERARQVAALMNSTSGRHERQPQARTFEIAARAWLEGRVLRSTYAGSQGGAASPVELAIYFVEVNPRNHEVYAIGVNELKPAGGIRVYRLSRLKTPTLIDRTYDIPPEFNPVEYLSNAWGIMSGTPKRVELHFTPEVAHRVQEVQFPPLLEPLLTLSTGHVRVVIGIGHWLELLPWILGWGADVEVVAPSELRQKVAESLTAGAALYRT